MCSVFSLEYMFLETKQLSPAKVYSETDVPLDTYLGSGEVQEILDGDEVDESVADITACQITSTFKPHTKWSLNIPFWKSIRRYIKSIRRGQTLSMKFLRSLSVILFGIFLIMTVVRVSMPPSIA